MREPTPEALVLSVLMLKRKRVVGILRGRLVFTGNPLDRVRRSEVTAIVAEALGKNSDNVALIQYVGDTMIGLRCHLIRRGGIYYYRGVRSIEPATKPSEGASG